MPTQDEEIARHLREALASGELAGTEGFGKPLPLTRGCGSWLSLMATGSRPQCFSACPPCYGPIRR